MEYERVLNLRDQVTKHIDIDLIVSESAEIITIRPQRQEQDKIMHNVHDND